MRAPNRQRLRLSSGTELSFITSGESSKPAVLLLHVTPCRVAAGERGSRLRTASRRGSYETAVPRWEPQFDGEKPLKPLRGRSLGTKLSEVEYARVEAAALKAGVGLSEWCRRAVLEFAERDGSQPAEKVVLAELLSLRSVLLSVVFQMSKGQAVSEEENAPTDRACGSREAQEGNGAPR